MKKCLIDAGPLIALFDKSDNYHERILKFMQKFEGRLVSTWAVITEVLYMLDFNVQVQVDFLRWIGRGALEIPELSLDHISRIIELSQKYSDVPMDFADATLIVISEIEKIDEIITIDSDFQVYRNIRKEMLRNIFDVR
jgi:predicted nucleic acid-binding protein